MIHCKLKELLAERGLSVSKVARMADLAWKTVDLLVKDQGAQFDRVTLDKICRVLECQPGDLFEFIP